jgi:hypothetical protein
MKASASAAPASQLSAPRRIMADPLTVSPESAAPMVLEDIKRDMDLAGIEPCQIVSVVACVPVGSDAAQLVYRTPDGSIRERLLSRSDEPNVSLATLERPWSFDGDGEAFRLVCGAKRIDFAYLFDPIGSSRCNRPAPRSDAAVPRRRTCESASQSVSKPPSRRQ